MKSTNKKTNLALAPVLDVHHAGEFLDACQKWAEVSGALVLQADSVERVTTPALQLLLALIKQRSQRNLKTTLQAPSEAFTKAVAALGLTPYFKEHIANG